MRKRTAYLAAAAALGLGAIFATSAQAAYTMTFQEVGGNVVEMGAGTLDTTDLTDNGSPFSEVAAVSPTGGQVFSGSTSSTPVEFFTGVSGPVSFGPGIETEANASSGDFVGLEGNGEGFLFTPVGFTSGALSETSTYLGATFASLGLTPGTYVYTWGAGDHADSFTIDISSASATPEPSTWAMMALGFAGLGFAAFRRRAPRETLA
jgi:PEP-CTERM motif